MRKATLMVALGLAVMAGACKKTADGGVEVEKPVVGVQKDTVHPPTVQVGTDTHTVAVPKVEVRKDSAKVVTPTVSVKKP